MLGLAITIPGSAVVAYTPLDPMLSRIPCRATVVSDASQVSKLVVAPAANLDAANTAWPRVNAHSAVQMGAMRMIRSDDFPAMNPSPLLCPGHVADSRFGWIVNYHPKGCVLQGLGVQDAGMEMHQSGYPRDRHELVD